MFFPHWEILPTEAKFPYQAGFKGVLLTPLLFGGEPLCGGGVSPPF